jgi:hypothetical protein
MQDAIKLLAERCESQDNIGRQLQEKYDDNEREMKLKMTKLQQEVEHSYGA